MGDEWASGVISFQGYGLHEKELELLLRFRSSSIESSKPYIVFSARMTVVKGDSGFNLNISPYEEVYS